MITDLKHYPAMKPSGVERLGGVPEHWDVRRAKRVFSPRKELAREDDVQLSATQAYGVIAQDEYERRAGRRVVKLSRHLDKRRHVEVDDFVISMRSFQGGLERAWARGCIRSSYIVIRAAGNVNVEFFGYLFKSEAYIQALRSTADFIRDGQDLNFDNFCAVDLPFPPTEEQAAIVRYLDYVDRRISRYIRAKQRLIELLEEEKQAIVHRAVTRGLDLDVRLKPSGVEWLGDVPEHWEVRRLVTSVQGCINGIWGSEPNGHQDLPCVRVADFDRVRFRVRLAEPTMRAIAPSERNRRLLQSGDLLLEKSGGGDSQPVGVVMLYDHDVEAVCSNFVARMPVAADCDSSFLTHLHSHLYAIRLNVRSIKQTTGIQNIDSSSYLSEPVAFPPFGEQVAIARYLDQATANIYADIARARREIELLGEYRTRIIADVVTGKLDVREAAAALPEADPTDLEDIIEIDGAAAPELAPELEEVAT